MYKPSNEKIEKRALNTLEYIIDKHPTLDYQFNATDKEMSWDGYIWLYNDSSVKQSKHSFESRIPVQIKGHCDTDNQYVRKNTISYSVELDDLKAYATEKGVLYFQIFLVEDYAEVFYASLYPSKIADYLDAAQKKGNKSHIKIRFTKLQPTASRIYEITKQFHDESSYQGSVFTPIVQDRIRTNDFDKIKILNLSVVGAKDEYSALRRLSTGDVCIYGKMEGDKYFRPLEGLDFSKFYVKKEVKQSISINSIVYYENYSCLADSEGGMVLFPSPNLELNLTQGTINFKCNSTLDVIYKDSVFLKALLSSKSYSIMEQNIDIQFNTIPDNFEEQLKYFIELHDTIEMIGFKINVPISDLSIEQQNQLDNLINIRLGRKNHLIQEGYTKYNWKFGDKDYPLLIIKNNSTIEMVSSLYTKQLGIYLPCEHAEDKKGYRMPLFPYHDVALLSNLYYYDFNVFKEQIDASDINVDTSGSLLQCVLKMINVYDVNHEKFFLDLANYLLSKIEPFESSEVMALNKLQIKKRFSGLSGQDINYLTELKSESYQVLFGKNVLLGNHEKASFYFSKFSVQEKEEYKTYPIYKLFQECASS